MKISMKIVSILTLFAVSACTAEKKVSSINLPDSYESSVQGLFLKGTDSKYCEVSANILEVTASQFLDYSWKNGGDLNFLITGIRSTAAGLEVSLAAPELCGNYAAARLEDSFKGVFDLHLIDEPTEYNKWDTDSLLEQNNLFDINLDFSEIDPRCAIIRKKELDLQLEDNLAIRYRLVVPLLYYNFSDERELFYFDSHCNNKHLFLEIIDKYYR